MEQFDSSEEATSRVLEQQQRNDEQQCPSCAAELTEASVWTDMHQATVCKYNFFFSFVYLASLHPRSC